MGQVRELNIDGYPIYIDQLKQLDTTVTSHDAGSLSRKIIEWNAKEIEQAMRPAISILNSLRSAAKDMAPDEMELSMQFEMDLKGETPVLKIVSAEASAQIAVKFTWKAEG